MLPHAGTDTRTWREVTGLGAELGALPELPRGSRDARVAIVFDWENWWAIENPDHPVVLDYLALVQRWYAAAHRRHVHVDLVRASADLSGYRLVIAPQLYLLTEDGAAALTAFVEAGGHLLVTAFSDVVDEHDRFRVGGFLTQLGPMLGVRVEEFGALVASGEGGPGQAEALFAGPFGAATGSLLAEEIHVDGATVIGSFTGGRLDGSPAFTQRAVGAGRAYYLATIPDAEGTASVLGHVLAEAGIAPVVDGLPETVEAIRRGDVVTVINHGAEQAEFVLAGTDLQSGETVATVSLAPYQYRFVTDFVAGPGASVRGSNLAG